MSQTSKAASFAALFSEADKAGQAAAEVCTPTPMCVVERANPLDDSSPIVKAYEPVMGGICGTAYVTIRPGTSAAAKYAKAEYGAFKAYYGGVQFSVNGYGQSVEKSLAYAGAFAGVLQGAGIKAYTDSWIN